MVFKFLAYSCHCSVDTELVDRNDNAKKCLNCVFICSEVYRQFSMSFAPELTPGQCEGEGDVVAVVAPLGGVAQVVGHGVKVVGVHEEEGKEKDEEVRVEVEGEVEENQRQPHIMDDMQMKVTDSRTT